jgi:DNA-binding XRE family transcriptional regulator
MDRRELRQQRKRHGLTQRQVAAWLGVKQPFVAQIEAGTRPIPTRERWHDYRPELDDLFASLARDRDDPEIRAKIGPAPRGPYSSAPPGKPGGRESPLRQ